MPCLAGCSKSSSPSSGSGGTPAACTGATCPDDPCGKDAISNVTKCCGSEIFDEAKKANGGKNPEIVFGTPPEGFDGVTNQTTGKITVRDTSNKCNDTETVYFELTNLAAKPAFAKVAAEAAAGTLSREEFAKAEAKIEYENVKKTIVATDKCKKKWGCDSQPFSFDSRRPAKDFDDYYDHYTAENYKDYYRNFWDTSYKAAYDAKHPAPPTH